MSEPDFTAPMGGLEPSPSPLRPAQRELIHRYLHTVVTGFSDSREALEIAARVVWDRSGDEIDVEVLTVAAVDWCEYFAGVAKTVFPQAQRLEAVDAAAMTLLSMVVHFVREGHLEGYRYFWPQSGRSVGRIVVSEQVIDFRGEGVSTEEKLRQARSAARRIEKALVENIEATEKPWSPPRPGGIEDKNLEWLAFRLVKGKAATAATSDQEWREGDSVLSLQAIEKGAKKASDAMGLTLVRLK